MIIPSLEDIKKYVGKYKIVPIKYEIMSDCITPIELLRKLKKVDKHCFILDSVQNQEFWGRYTYLGFSPKYDITCTNGEIILKDVNGDVIKKETDIHPGEFIKEILKDYTSPKLENMPTFTGGLVGYFSYDYIKYSEPKLVLDARDEDGFQDVDLMLFDKVIAFDNLKQKIYIIVNVSINADEFNKADNINKDNDFHIEHSDDIYKIIEANYNKAVEDIKYIVDLIKNGKKAYIEPAKLLSDFEPLFSKEEFCEMVEKAKKYIYEGDIFQVVLSNRLKAKMSGSLFDTYRTLRSINPSPYMFYFSGDTMEVAGASPETLVKLTDEVLYTFPLAGTRRRGKTKEEDLFLEKELLADDKELAEHNMLVDLGRNDLGKISKFGSVEVEEYMSIQKYSHVMHIGSTVKGIIREDLSAIDAVNSVLPAGTLSGAPKIRACEIINELENDKRGIYGGAIGYIDFTGNLDTCIAIRIAYKKDDNVYIRSGAGIVYDSKPELEYKECLNKAKAVVTSIIESTEVE